MGQHVSAHLSFKKNFQGTLHLAEGEIAIGVNPNEAKPYDLLQGALVSCLHSTLLDILIKKRIEIEGVEYEVKGEKRDDVPTMLQEVVVTATFEAHPKSEQIIKSMELACKYCSVYNTLAQVANMKTEVIFKDHEL